MRKLSVLILFGGISPEHEVSLRSAESVLNQIDHDKYNIFPVGITKEGDWILFGGRDYSMLPAGTWQSYEGNRRATLSPVHGQGLLSFENDCVVRERIDVVFPVLHGAGGEDGAIQGLLEIAGLPYVGPHIAASAACMDKCMTKLVADQAGVRQAKWHLVTRAAYEHNADAVAHQVEQQFAYPVFVKPAGTGSSVGVSKVRSREELFQALETALQYDRKVLVEEFIDGQEVECAAIGNPNDPATVAATRPGEILAGAEFYTYDDKYKNGVSQTVIPAHLSEEKLEEVRARAREAYLALGCTGLARCDFFVERGTGRVLCNELNTMPGFTAISMYPKLMEHEGLTFSALVDRLLRLAQDRRKGAY